MLRSVPALSGSDESTGEASGRLQVATGLPDDVRVALEAGHALYGLAARAAAEQDQWSAREHALFWMPMLELWPRPAGRAPTRDDFGLAVAILRRHGLPDDEIARGLCVARDTLRDRQRFAPADRGEAMLKTRASRLRAIFDREHERPPRLPRVYAGDVRAESPRAAEPWLSEGVLNGYITITPQGADRSFTELAWQTLEDSASTGEAGAQPPRRRWLRLWPS